MSHGTTLDECGEQRPKQRYVVVQSGPDPRDRTAIARDLFDSDGFQNRVRYANAIANRWWILTTEHSLVPPWKEVSGGYDTALADLKNSRSSFRDLESWQRRAYLMLRGSDGKWMGNAELIILADPEWCDALAPRLESHPCPVKTPFANITDADARREWVDYHLANPEEPIMEQDPLLAGPA